MKLFGLLRKPDWEHKDAARRLRAVQSGQDPQLLAKLGELAQSDPDPAVRAAAVHRCDDLALLERRLRGDHDAAVVSAARERLIDLLSRTQTAVEAGQAVLLRSHDDELLARIAERGAHAEWRRTALERSAKPALWLQRCIHDPDPALRLWLLERIDAPEALLKIAESVRKKDKRLTRAARDKLDALQLAAGDREAVRRRALTLCERYADLARALPEDREAQFQALNADWVALREQVEADLQRRTDGAQAMTEAALRAARGEPIPGHTPQPSETVEVTPAVADSAASNAMPEALPSPELEALIAQLPAASADDFEAQIDAALQVAKVLAAPGNAAVEAQQRRLQQTIAERRRQRREQAERAAADAQAQAERQLEALEQALAEGSPGQARAARDAISTASLPRSLQRRLGHADQQLAKLERWQRWSGSKVRQRLCDEAEALHGSGLHPDALANKVKALQAEWARLDALEGETAAGAEHGLSRRFRALCQRALAPARPYFEKRRELRAERGEQVAGLIETSSELPKDLPALQRLRGELREALQSLDGVAPAQRGEQGRRLRERVLAVDAALRAGREQAALDKRRLLAKLRRDLSAAAPEAAVGLAKSAQAEWKRLPRADRASEDALWQELRELVDPLFGRLREQEDARRSEQAEAQATAQAILDELEALAGDRERLLHADAHLESLQSRWRALSSAIEPAEPEARPAREPNRRPAKPPARRGHPWDARFEQASARVLAAQREVEALRDAQQLEQLGTAAVWLDDLAAQPAEQRDRHDERWQGFDLPADARAAMQARYHSLLEGTAPEPDPEGAERLALRAELAAGLESPAASQALRRQLQMQRLAAKLEGAAAPSAQDEVRDCLIELQAKLTLPPGQREPIQTRILAALRTVQGG